MSVVSTAEVTVLQIPNQWKPGNGRHENTDGIRQENALVLKLIFSFLYLTFLPFPAYLHAN